MSPNRVVIEFCTDLYKETVEAPVNESGDDCDEDVNEEIPKPIDERLQELNALKSALKEYRFSIHGI